MRLPLKRMRTHNGSQYIRSTTVRELYFTIRDLGKCESNDNKTRGLKSRVLCNGLHLLGNNKLNNNKLDRCTNKSNK